jgi:hypothetical protein
MAHHLVRTSAAVLMALSFMASSAMAFGSGSSPSARWSAAYFDILPPEVRKAVARSMSCRGEPLAGRPFARYLDAGGVKLIALHFSYFRCGGSETQCGDLGCLHEVFVLDHGRYRLAKKIIAPDVTLLSVGGEPVIEVPCRARTACEPVLRWNGSKFVK